VSDDEDEAEAEIEIEIETAAETEIKMERSWKFSSGVAKFTDVAFCSWLE
jgi:hypothetical protein